MTETEEQLYEKIKILLSQAEFLDTTTINEESIEIWRKLKQSIFSNDPTYLAEVSKFVEFLFNQGVIAYHSLGSFAYRLFQINYKINYKINFQTAIDQFLLLKLAEDNLFKLVLNNSIIADWTFEPFLWRLPHYFLEKVYCDEDISKSILPLMAGLAQQCWNNEYIYPSTKEEDLKVEKILNGFRNEMSTYNPPNEKIETTILVIGMYQSLISIPELKEYSRNSFHLYSEIVGNTVKKQILEPLEESKISPTLRSIGKITNEISLKVQTQYESHPFAKWFNLGVALNTVTANLEKFNSQYSLPGEFRKERMQILVPGCGTGRHPLRMAKENPEAEIWAIELSRTSLAYAVRKAREYDIRNINFLWGDLLEIDGLDKKFHHIDCIGVLHHMEDPILGFRALDRALLPGGVMRLGLYSTAARMHITHFRQKNKSRGVQSNRKAMIDFRKQLMTEEKGPVLSRILACNDFYTLSGIRDLLFHSQESSFTLTSIEKIIEDFNYHFLAFHPQGLSKLFRQLFSENGHTNNFENWKKFEPYYTGTLTLFDFWIQKKMVFE